MGYARISSGERQEPGRSPRFRVIHSVFCGSVAATTAVLESRGVSQEGHPDVEQLLEAAGRGDSAAAEVLLPLLYDELRDLAVRQMAREPPGMTLQPTALVHEAYLRLGRGQPMKWESRRHFFATAAIVMRRILVERARRKAAAKYGGDRDRIPLDDAEVAGPDNQSVDWLALDEALTALHERDPDLGEIVSLRYFAGLSVDQTAEVVGISASTVDRRWRGAKAFLLLHMSESNGG